MQSVAVICEYNPFHNGHICLLKEIRRSFPGHVIISVMSGNTVQRGEFAIQHKYVRAMNALLNGTDLVFELPFPFSVSSAEQFANAGVFIAHALKAEILAFGSESGDLERLKKATENLNSDNFLSEMEKQLKSISNEPFISIRERTYEKLFGEKLFNGGNDILALEYLKHIKKYNDISPYAIHRTEPFSATAARSAIYENNKDDIRCIIPENTVFGEIHKGLKGLSSLVLGYLRLTPSYDNGNGIRNAIKYAAEKSVDYEGFICSLPTKTYTLSRLRREIIAMIFAVTDADKNAVPQYTVLLGANETGLKYLSEKKKEIFLPVLTKKADAKSLSKQGTNQLKKAELVDSIYSIGLSREGVGYFRTPIIL